ncbi:MAG: two-component sensor histidine kinase [Archangium sp.]|nr:two-component sensor histidine kinase [Archangium sp.]
MASPETVEFLSFRRTFTLLILLVVLPSAGLSGFGIVAIVNERAAVEKRLEVVWTNRLAAAQPRLIELLESADATVDGGLSLTLDGGLLTAIPFTVTDHLVKTDEARLRALVQSVEPALGALPDQPIVFSAANPQGTVLLTALNRDGVVHGAQLDLNAIDRTLAGVGAVLTPPAEPARFALLPVKREPPESVLARIASGVSEVREAALGIRELASLALPPPVQDFRLVVFAVGEDPVARASTRNRVWYSVLLGLFYVTLLLGVLFTGRTLYREARLSRLKTDFVSLVSHELRTPLTSIRLFIDMLAMGRVEQAEMQTVLEVLSKETARLSGMIDKVLDWSRIESGSRTYDRALHAPGAIVEEAVEAFRAQRVGAVMNFTVDVEEALPLVRVDRSAIAGAVLNLLQNAFKYTGESKRIALKAERRRAEVVISVEDNGIGIPRRELRRIFERFYRVDSLLSRVTEGSGLGLSISQRIVQAHGGTISVDSTPEKGSTFRIHLPVAPTT